MKTKEEIMDFVGIKVNEIENYIGEKINIRIEISNNKNEDILFFSQYAD